MTGPRSAGRAKGAPAGNVLARFLLILLGGAAFQPLRAQESGIVVGAAAPAVKVNDLNGRPVDLGRYIGKKPVFLEFWATWCEQCEELLPDVREAQSRYGDKVEFIGINVTVNQTPERVREYLEVQRPGFRALYDDQGASIRAYEVPATSYVVIVDQAGKVAYTGIGGKQDFEKVLRKIVQE
jgi:thiol-disulfide isomerase/thioredoxin